MRKAMLGALAGAGLAMAAVGTLDPQSEVFAQRPASEFQSDAGRQLIAMPGPTNENGQLFVVVDPQMRSMSVYHVDRSTGKIELKSVRNIHYDLQITNLNTEDPLPQHIRSSLEQRHDG